MLKDFVAGRNPAKHLGCIIYMYDFNLPSSSFQVFNSTVDVPLGNSQRFFIGTFFSQSSLTVPEPLPPVGRWSVGRISASET